jgi:hypothetical protein
VPGVLVALIVSVNVFVAVLLNPCALYCGQERPDRWGDGSYTRSKDPVGPPVPRQSLLLHAAVANPKIIK